MYIWLWPTAYSYIMRRACRRALGAVFGGTNSSSSSSSSSIEAPGASLASWLGVET